MILGRRDRTPAEHPGGEEAPIDLDTLPYAPPAGEDHRVWVMRSPVTLWAAAVIVVMAIVGGLVLAISGGGTDADPTPLPAAPPATPRTAAPARPDQAGADTGFGTPTIDFANRRVDVPHNPYGQPLPQNGTATAAPWSANAVVAAPAGVKWELFFGLVLPYSTSDGPTALDGPLPSGFAHTPQGAALAAYQIFGRQLEGDRAARTMVARELTVAATAAGHDEYVNQVAGAAALAHPQLFLRPDAFRIVTYDPDFVVVQFAIPIGYGGQDAVQSWEAIQHQLVWSAGVWKMKTGDPDPQLPQIDSLAGWTPW